MSERPSDLLMRYELLVAQNAHLRHELANTNRGVQRLRAKLNRAKASIPKPHQDLIYTVEPRGNEYAVLTPGGNLVGCFDSEDMAYMECGHLQRAMDYGIDLVRKEMEAAEHAAS